MHDFKLTLFLVAVIATIAGPPRANAQVNVGRAIQNQAEYEVRRKARQETSKAIRCAFGDIQCIEKAKQDDHDVVLVDQDGNVITDDDGNPITDPQEAQKKVAVKRNPDFTRGERILFKSDFADEPIGRFPASQLVYEKGNAQIVEKDGQNVLEASANTTFRVQLEEPLPEDFTVEFDLQIGAPNMIARVLFTPLETSYSRYESDYLQLYRSQAGIYRKADDISVGVVDEITTEMVHFALQVDGEYAILYAGPIRIANMPVTNFMTGDMIEFQLSANPRFFTYISNIVIAGGVEDMYGTIMETGEFTTYGINFETASADITDDSAEILDQMLEMLTAHPDLAVEIIGHTDAEGGDEYNQDLSERRAQAVVGWLVDGGVPGEQMSAAGMGESDPVADNATAEGRAQNRRVVIKRRA